MIILTSSYNKSANSNLVSDLGLTDEAVLKQFSSTHRKRSVFQNVRVRGAVRNLDLQLDDSLWKEINLLSGSITSVSAFDFVNDFCVALFKKNRRFYQSVNEIVTFIDTNSSSKLDFKEVIRSPAAYPDVMGLATEMYLRSNRVRRDRYNDIIFGAVMVRENVRMKIPSGGILINGTGVIPDLDFDSPRSKLMDTSIGIGQRHTAMWSDNYHWLGLDGEKESQRYLSFGLYPWWMQALWMDADLIRLSSRRHWLLGKKAVPAKPDVSQSFYPHYLLGQPALWHSDLMGLLSTNYFKSFDVLREAYPALHLPSTYDIFTKGLGNIGVRFLFNSSVSDGLLRDLIAGSSLYQYRSSGPSSPFTSKITASVVGKTLKANLVLRMDSGLHAETMAERTARVNIDKRSVAPLFVSFKF